MRSFAYTGSTHVECKPQNRRLAQVIILIFITAVFFFGHLQITDAQTVHIPDPNLRTVLESALGKEAGEDITQADMQEVTGLDAFESGVRNLTGLEFATNLIELHLGLNRISDVSPLKDLTKLTKLDLHRNQIISDVSPLKNLTNLAWLSLRGNRISDMSPLKDLKRLTFLHIGYNVISDVFPLKDSTNLTFLNLDANRISDVSLLKGLTNLTRLELDDNIISDVSPLKDLTKLTFLNLNDNIISDVAPLKDLTKLTFIDLHGNKISNVSPLKDLTNLTALRLHENRISDVTPFKNLTNLRVLKLDDNIISDVSPLKNLTNLTELYLSNNHISDFSPLAGLIENLVEYDNSHQTDSPIQFSDVNRDGIVNIIDLALVASYYEDADFADAASFGIYPDVNGDGVIDIRDLVVIAGAIDAAAAAPAPALRKPLTETSDLTAENLAEWVQLAKQLDTQDLTTKKGIIVLEALLAALTDTENLPKETALLANYPNPFNPETWIPYQLSKSSEVSISIHSLDGKVVRLLELGVLPAGVYHSKSRAAYWNGCNGLGEAVASGIYFYTFTAGDFTATGKMIIRK